MGAGETLERRALAALAMLPPSLRQRILAYIRFLEARAGK